MKVNPYLNYGGNCEQAFRFYEKHLGGKIVAMMKHGEQPGPKDPAAPEGVLYAHMIFDGTEIVGSDVAPARFQPMRSVYLSLAVGSIEEAERVHKLLAEGGEIFMPMEETFLPFASAC